MLNLATRLDGFLAALPQGAQFFALLEANPRLVGLLGHLLGVTPVLADALARDPALFDVMLAPDAFAPLPGADLLTIDLAVFTAPAEALEDMLDKAEHKVKCRAVRWDRNCHVVAQCTVEAAPAPLDLGGYLIASGMAYGFRLDEALPWEARASQRYAGAEAEARKAKRGLWPVWLGEK